MESKKATKREMENVVERYLGHVTVVLDTIFPFFPAALYGGAMHLGMLCPPRKPLATTPRHTSQRHNQNSSFPLYLTPPPFLLRDSVLYVHNLVYVHATDPEPICIL